MSQRRAFPLAPSLAWFWALTALYGLYYGLTEGASKAWVADLVEPDQRGEAFGWYHTAVGLATLPSSILFGAIWQGYGCTPAFLLSAGLALLAAIGLALLVRPQDRTNP